MNGRWTKLVATVVAMMACGTMATAGTPGRPRASRAASRARHQVRTSVWDDTDIVHVVRRGRPGCRGYDSVGDDAFRAARAGVTDGTSNTLKATARPAGLYDSPGDDTVTTRRQSASAGVWLSIDRVQARQ